MLWFLWQMFWCLLFAFLLGAGLMWLLWRMFGNRFGGGGKGGSIGGAGSNGIAVRGQMDSQVDAEQKARIALLEEENKKAVQTLKADVRTKDEEISTLRGKLASSNQDGEIAKLKANLDAANKAKQEAVSGNMNIAKAKDGEISKLKADLDAANKAKQEAVSGNANAAKAKDDQISKLKADL